MYSVRGTVVLLSPRRTEAGTLRVLIGNTVDIDFAKLGEIKEYVVEPESNRDFWIRKESPCGETKSASLRMTGLPRLCLAYGRDRRLERGSGFPHADDCSMSQRTQGG
jgi:hypothetical protein